MLGAEHEPVLTSAVTAQLQPHLPPLDTVDAVLRLKSGGSGTLSISFGTTFSGSEYAVACEKGTVVRTFEKFGKVVVKKDGKEVESKEFPDEENGVNQEIKAWAEALEKGTPNPLQSPEQALADLALVSLDLFGESDGIPPQISIVLTLDSLKECWKAGRRTESRSLWHKLSTVRRGKRSKIRSDSTQTSQGIYIYLGRYVLIRIV